MRVDIGDILDDWPFEPGQILARRVRGADGRDKLQLRQELGILQMEVTGRPDGQRPMGFDTYYAYYSEQLERFVRNGEAEAFSLDEEACQRLRAEGLLYYYRYIGAFVLEDFPLVIADTNRSLELMDITSQYAQEDTDRYMIEQYRPYVLTMRARAQARIALGQNQTSMALETVQRAIDEVVACLEAFGLEEETVPSGELAILRALTEEIESQVPVDPVLKLKKQLDTALSEERYEEAAVLRDQLKRLDQHPGSAALGGDSTSFN